MNLHRPRESSVSLPVPLKGSLLGDNHGHARGALILWPSLWPVFKSTAVSPAHPPAPFLGASALPQTFAHIPSWTWVSA